MAALEDAALEPVEDPPKRSTLLTVCPFILGNEFCERLAFYGLSTNLIIYMTRVMGEDNGFAAIQLNLFEGTCYLTPLLGAWLADSAWGRYKTILIFSSIYFLGMVLLTLSAWLPGMTPSPDEYASPLQNAFLYTSLYVVALGTGGIKPNVSAFGADQFDESDPQDRKEKTSFFNWFYFFVNIGSLLAVTVIVWVQENISWAVGFAIPAAVMACAIATFVAGAPLYTHVAPTESPISRVFKVVWAAYKAPRRSASPHDESSLDALLGDGANASLYLPAEANGGSLYQNGDGGVNGGTHGAGMGRPTKSLQWLDQATEARVQGGARRFTQRQVEEVKLVLRLLPIFATTVLYWTIYMQMGSFFVAQGVNMDRALALPWGGSFVIPAASLASINTVSIVALIPIYDKLLAPGMRKLGRPITLLQRIGWGLLVCVASMLMAGYVEHHRLSLCNFGTWDPPSTGGSPDGPFFSRFTFSGSQDDSHSSSSPDAGQYNSGGGNHKVHCLEEMSVWWQVPQYLLVGLSEVFTSIGQLEIFYDQAPDVMRSCSMALQLLSVCIGSYLSGAVVYGFSVYTSRYDPGGQGWLPKDLNQGRLDLFFLTLAALMVLNLLIFLRVASQYEYKAVEHVKRLVLPRSMQRPPRPPTHPPRSLPVDSRGASVAHPLAVPGAASIPSSPAPSIFSRSLAFMPKSPAMPAPFR
ncbi:hypothetical protein D9Q98_006837 [Chlorella vulgaris]|uniref:Uncharacterized protein n=1 Tax=Chlorella vulgaris TaxID=3077 RepID=A0A9D4TIX2_CHLVU|nr:hypothetical protein D9Q98_006837 [Chlorella vulgaris]